MSSITEPLGLLEAEWARMILESMKQRLSDKLRWTQLSYARTKDGRLTDAEDPAAFCWCQAGARYRAVQDLSFKGQPIDALLAGSELVLKLLDSYANSMGFTSAVGLNDKGKYEDVMLMIDASLARLAQLQGKPG